MQIELERFLIDICTGSVLNYEQATQLWKIIGNKRKMWRAAEDANQRGYEATFHLATLGGFNEAGSSIVDQGLSVTPHALIVNTFSRKKGVLMLFNGVMPKNNSRTFLVLGIKDK